MKAAIKADEKTPQEPECENQSCADVADALTAKMPDTPLSQMSSSCYLYLQSMQIGKFFVPFYGKIS
jgi:hypothetical protein